MTDRYEGLYEWAGVPFTDLEPQQEKMLLERRHGGKYAPHVLALQARIRDLEPVEGLRGFRAGPFPSLKAAESYRTCAGNAVRRVHWGIADETKKIGKYPFATMLVHEDDGGIYVDFIRTK